MNEAGWTDNPSVLLRYQVLAAMAKGESDAVDIAYALKVGPDEVGDVFSELADEGLAGLAPLRGGDSFPHDATLTASGRALARRLDAARTPGNQKRACIAAMLAWLDAHYGEAIPGTDSFSTDVRAHYFGEPFDNNIVIAVARQLLKDGFVKGFGTGQGIILRPEITTQGQVVSRHHGGDLTSWAAQGAATTTINVSGSQGIVVANNSPGAHQSVHVSTDRSEQVLNLAAALEQMTPALGLDPASIAKAAGLVGQLREAAGEADPSRLQRLIGAVKEVAISGTGSAAGTALVALADLILRAT